MTRSVAAQGVIPASRALKELFEQGTEGLQVLLGPVAVEFDDDVLIVAAPTDGGAAILGTPSPSDQGHSQSWDFEVVCLLSCYSGDSRIDLPLVRAETLFNDLVRLVEDNPQLDDEVSVADIGNRFQVSMRNDKDGAAVEIAFTVACEIY